MRDSLLVPAALLALALVASSDGGLRQPTAYARVEVTAEASVETVVALLERLGGEIEVQSGRRVQARLPEQQLPALRAATAVLRVERPALLH